MNHKIFKYVCMVAHVISLTTTSPFLRIQKITREPYAIITIKTTQVTYQSFSTIIRQQSSQRHLMNKNDKSERLLIGEAEYILAFIFGTAVEESW